jgi:histidinol-phosphate/aromatic aminotransferase/cobyric acid decarboxylase-like protein
MDEGIVRVSVGTPSENDAAVAAIAAVRSAAAAA